MNPATEKMFGYAPAELVGQNIKLLMPPAYHDQHDSYLARYLETRQPRIIGIGRELVARRKDGTIFPVSLAVSEVDHLNLVTEIIRDLSDVRNIQQHVLNIATEEKRRIGLELHDGIAQELTGMSLYLRGLLNRIPDPPPVGPVSVPSSRLDEIRDIGPQHQHQPIPHEGMIVDEEYPRRLGFDHGQLRTWLEDRPTC